MSRKLFKDEREEFPQVASVSNRLAIQRHRFPELNITPENNLEEAAALGAEVGTAKVGHLIIQHVASMYPPELVASAVRPLDRDRSEALDEDEVADAADLPKGYRVVEGSARVRGDQDGNRVVSFLVENEESGRTGRAVVSYGDDFKRSERSFEQAQEEADEGSGGGVKVLSDKESQKAAKKAAEEAEKLRAENEELRKRLEEAQSQADDPEPFEGYGELSGGDLAKKIRDGGKDAYGEDGLQAILAYEEKHADRKGVKDAVSKALKG